MKLELTNLTKRYGPLVALDDFSITFEPGIYGVLGANGAGKSTMISLITDNVKRDGGSITFDGEDILKLGDGFRAVLGYMPQQQGIYEAMTARSFVTYMGRLKGMKGKELRAQVDEVLELTNLSSVLFAASQLTFVSYSTESQDKWYIAYVRDMEGPLDGTADEYLAHAWKSIPAGSEDAGALMSALAKVERQVALLRERAAERGYRPWILDGSDYDLIYGPTSQDRQRLNAAAAMILAAFCCAALGAYERQSGVTPMVRATKKGRGGLFRRKVLLTALLSAFVWAAVYAREVQALFTWFQPRTLAAPVQNIDALAGFPVVLTVSQYLILLYAIRLDVYGHVSQKIRQQFADRMEQFIKKVSG